MSSSALNNVARVPALEADQVYITHCLKSDSLLQNEAGISIRASSIDDQEILQFAYYFPGHFIPPELRRLNPTPIGAPRRLAIVRMTDGQVALVHSSYVEKDTMGRTGSYFTHFLCYSDLLPVDALQTWGSPGWRTQYPQGASKHLQCFEGIPPPGPLNESLLKDFLDAGGKPPSDQLLGVVTYPNRLHSDHRRRRDFLRMAIQGWLRVRQVDDSAHRGRFYILAEPGLVALLLYGVTRLLPKSLTSNLTFSTYECLDTSLRDFKFAKVIGTFSNNPQRGLDADFLGSRGYALDTFKPDASSVELRNDVPPFVDELVSMAEADDWEAIKELHAVAEAGRQATDESLDAAVKVHLASRNVLGKSFQVEDLLTLASAPRGRDVLQKCDEWVWPCITQWSLVDERIRQKFASELRARSDELIVKAVDSLERNCVQDWQQQWSLIRAVSSTQTIVTCFERVLATARARVGNNDGHGQYPYPARHALLQEWIRLHERTDRLPLEQHWLIRVESDDEIRDLFGQKLPRGCLGQAACHALLGDSTSSCNVYCLVSGIGGDAYAGICEALEDFSKDAHVIVCRFLTASGKGGKEAFRQLLDHGMNLDTLPLEEVLCAAGADDNSWNSFWFEGTNFVNLVSKLSVDSLLAQRLWKRFCDRITVKCVYGSEQEWILVQFLDKARRSMNGRVPKDVERALDDWLLLQNHLQGVAAPIGKLKEVCARRGIESRASLLKEYFDRRTSERSSQQQPTDTWLSQFALTTLGTYAEPEEAFTIWRGLVKAYYKQAGSAQLVFFYALPPKERLRLASRSRQHLDPGVYETLMADSPDHPDSISDPGVNRQTVSVRERTGHENFFQADQSRHRNVEILKRNSASQFVRLTMLTCLLMLILGVLGYYYVSGLRGNGKRERASKTDPESVAFERKDPGSLAENPKPIGQASSTPSNPPSDRLQESSLQARLEELQKELTTERASKTHVLEEKTKLEGEYAREKAKSKKAEEDLISNLYYLNIILAERHLSELHESKRKLAEELLNACRAEQRDWEWNFLLGQCSQRILRKDKAPLKEMFYLHPGSVFINDDGNRLAAIHPPEKVKIWLLDNSKNKPVDLNQNNVPAVAFSAVAFSADGLRLATGTRDGRLSIWDVKEGPFSTTFQSNEEAAITCVGFSSDCKTLATGSENGNVTIWDIENKKKLHQLRNDPANVAIRGLALFGSKGQFRFCVAVWQEKSPRVHIHEIHLGEEPFDTVLSVENPNHEKGSPIKCLAMSADGSSVAFASGKDVFVTEWKRKQPIGKMLGHTADVSCISYSPNGKRVVSGSVDGKVKVWDVDPRNREKHKCQEMLSFPEEKGNQVVSVRFGTADRLYSVHANGTIVTRGGKDDTAKRKEP